MAKWTEPRDLNWTWPERERLLTVLSALRKYFRAYLKFGCGAECGGFVVWQAEHTWVMTREPDNACCPDFSDNDTDDAAVRFWEVTNGLRVWWWL